jgi:hypothetical protein
MPRVTGFLRVLRRGHRPGQGLPGEGEGPVDPDYGIEEGEPPQIEPPDVPDPPSGIWPPLTPEHPWRPIPSWPERPGHGLPPGAPPAGGVGGRPPERPGPGEPDEELPPGSIWPPLPPGVHGKFLALVLIGGGGRGLHYRYVVVDADARPEPPAGGIGGRPPDRPGPGTPPREPKL